MAKGSGSMKNIGASKNINNIEAPIYTMEQKIDALMNYTAGDSFDINSFLNKSMNLGSYSEDIKRLDQLMGNINEIALYRAIQNVPELLSFANVDSVEKLAGKTIIQKGYISTTKSKEALEWLDTDEPISTIIHFKGVNNIKGVDVNKAMSISGHAKENYFKIQKEVLVQRGAKYFVDKVKKDSEGITHIFAKFIK